MFKKGKALALAASIAATTTLTAGLASAPLAMAAETRITGAGCLITLNTDEANAIAVSPKTDGTPIFFTRADAAAKAAQYDHLKATYEKDIAEFEEIFRTEPGSKRAEFSKPYYEWTKRVLAALPETQKALVACSEGRNHNAPQDKPAPPLSSDPFAGSSQAFKDILARIGVTPR